MSFNSKSVESITGKLTKTVAELEKHAKAQLDHAAAQKLVAQAAEAAHKAHTREHELALKVASNIKALLGA